MVTSGFPSFKPLLRSWILLVIAWITRRIHPPGLNRILKRFYHPDRRQADYLQTVIRYDPRLRIHVNTSDFLEWLVFFYGYHEPEVVREIRRSFRPGFVAFDIGANVGCHALVMAVRAGPSGRVFAAEPNPAARRRLLENIELNRLDNLVTLPYAFSDRERRAELFVPVEGTANRGVASLYPNNVNYRKFPVPVEVRTLDGEAARLRLTRLDFVKIDTEGNEMNVLRGGVQVVCRYRPRVVFEYSRRTWKISGATFEEAARHFEGLGYSLSLIGRRSLQPVPSTLPETANFLARPRTR